MLHSKGCRITGSLLAALALAACSDGTGVDALGRRGDESTACDPDRTAPAVSSIAATPNTLWPPNHKLVPVLVSLAASDGCSGVSSAVTSVTSDEPVDDLGDGNTEPDWVVTGPLALLLRAERSGLGDGRVYTVGVTTTDAAGNATTSFTTVVVPHDQGSGEGGAKP
jgi:hypothetical protein